MRTVTEGDQDAQRRRPQVAATAHPIGRPGARQFARPGVTGDNQITPPCTRYGVSRSGMSRNQIRSQISGICR